MEPLNRAEGNKAIKKFIVINGILLFAVLVSSYFLFSTPLKLFRTSLKSFIVRESRQSSLNKKVSDITGDISQLLKVDEDLKNTKNVETQGTLLQAKKERQADIMQGFMALREDTAQVVSPIVGTSCRNYIWLLGAFMHSRETLELLRGDLEKSKADVSKVEALEEENKDLRDEVSTQKLLLAGKPAAGGGGQAGGDGSANDAEAKKLKSELDKKQVELDKVTADLNQCLDNLKKAKAHGIEVGSAPAQNEVDERLFKTASNLYKKSENVRPANQRVYLTAAQEVLLQIKETYPNRQIWSAKWKEVERKLEQFGRIE